MCLFLLLNKRDFDSEILDIWREFLLDALLSPWHQNFDGIATLHRCDDVSEAIWHRQLLLDHSMLHVLLKVEVIGIFSSVWLVWDYVGCLVLRFHNVQRNYWSITFNLQQEWFDPDTVWWQSVLVKNLHPSQVCHVRLVFGQVWVEHNLVVIYLI